MPLPIVAGAAILGGSALAGSALSAYGSNKAAQVSARQAERTAVRNQAIAEDAGIKQEALTKPWIDTGLVSMSDIQKYVGDPANFKSNAYQGPTQFSGDVDVTQDPSYKFRLQQGIDALDNSAAKQGSLKSGKQQKALMELGQNMAAQEYAAAYKRGEDTLAGNFTRGFNVNQDTNAQTVANRAAYLNALGGLMNTGSGAMQNQNSNITGLASASMGNSTQLGVAQAAQAAAPWQAMSTLGGTLSSTGLNTVAALGVK